MQQRYALNKNKYLLPQELQQLETLLKRSLIDDKRNALLLTLGLKTGARATELLNLKKQDLNSEYQTVFIKGIKGSNDREIPLPPLIFKHLEAYSLGLKSDTLFDFTYNRFRQIWQHYRPIEKKLHCLRHTFAIQLYRKTRDIRLVQVALGHRNVMNTMIYADYVYSQEELRKLIL